MDTEAIAKRIATVQDYRKDRRKGFKLSLEGWSQILGEQYADVLDKMNDVVDILEDDSKDAKRALGIFEAAREKLEKDLHGLGQVIHSAAREL